MHTEFETDIKSIDAIAAFGGPVWEELNALITDFALSDLEEIETPAGHA